MIKLEKKSEEVKWKDDDTLYWPDLTLEIHNLCNGNDHNKL
jgi:hypothetical protein